MVFGVNLSILELCILQFIDQLLPVFEYVDHVSILLLIHNKEFPSLSVYMLNIEFAFQALFALHEYILSEWYHGSRASMVKACDRRHIIRSVSAD